MKKNFLFAGLLLCTALSGCAVANKVEDHIKTVGDGLATDNGTLPKSNPRSAAVRESDAPILGTRVVRPIAGLELPGGVQNQSFGWGLDAPVTLLDVAAKVTEVTGIPVRVNDRRAGVGGGAGGGGGTGGDMVVTGANAAQAFQAAYGGESGGFSGRAFPGVFVPAFEGTLGQFLQSVETRFDMTVAVRDGGLVFDAFTEFSCIVPAPPTTAVISAEVSGATTGAASGPSGSTSSQGSTTTATLDTFAEIKQYLEKIVGNSGVFEVSPSQRRFKVVGPSDLVRQAKNHCEELTSFLSTRVAVEATIVEVSITEGDDYGLNLEPLWKGAGGLSVGLAGLAPQIVDTAGAGSITVLPLSEGGRSLHWAGSQAFIKAASTAGRLAQSRHGIAVLQNGRSQTLNLTTRQDYIKNISNNPGSANTAASSGTQTDTINYGYSMQITAHVMGRDEIQVSGSLTISDLAAQIDKPAGNGQVVQLLTVPQRSFDVDIPLGNGETLVMAGNENVRARRDQAGIINPAFFGLGGSDKAQFETTRVVLFLTAYRLNPPRVGAGGAS
ncbi:type IVB pilus formation R64 PilN family outer membrane protein [Azospirillum brasilense]|nr:type IVB pilus formation R64 PilN family outer membrane protein [Azospirillum brasilense]